jgi:uncharacterized protein (DUF488 family)
VTLQKSLTSATLQWRGYTEDGKKVDRALYTIGYEGAPLDDFWATLQAAGVSTVLDIRDVPFSRKPGFSKKALSAEAERRGVRYVHLQGLGDPKEGREAAKAGLHAKFVTIFSAHLERPAAVADLAKAVELAKMAPTCLLCYERDPKECHRTIVASRMMSAGGLATVHLGVRAGLAAASRNTQEFDGIGQLAFG